MQGNAERLPIRTDSIEVVYSNGVLHHTPHFEAAMDEVHRVLKPGGRAVIGLYATYSTAFGLVHLRGAIRHIGRRARSRFMSAHTEHAWRTAARVNPWTKTYSTAEIAAVVRRHSVHGLTFRANGNPIGEIPYFGRRLMHLRAARRLDKALEPWFGSMLIASFTK